MPKSPLHLNLKPQSYKGIQLQLINRKDYIFQKAKRFTINGTNQNVWIPNSKLERDGSIKAHVDIDFVFKRSRRQCELAGINIDDYLKRKD